MNDGRRFLLGLTGPPGAGKSTLAAALVAALGPEAIAVPMDGFHRRQAELIDLGRAGRKGAPDTFDVDAYVARLARLGADADHPIAVPAFDRERDDPVPDAIVVLRSHRIVVTEGNYLLLGSGGWERVRPLLDRCWFVDADPAQRVERLIARHVAFGRSPADAEEWVRRSDEANARLVDATRGRADLTVGAADPVTALAARVRRAAGR